MHLRQIKIAGFKSFADPVVLTVNEPLVGIVGPNGCGKSNVIDAVRWVLGEGRVAELRGTQRMSELIFAGSTARKELGRASVELILSNEDGRIQGTWGQYSELSIKRVVTRDGESTYWINGTSVRRRDVQDLFAGTGLGPKSYAIISQGMIGQFIKARPEELRVYFEEAAGVSLYRDRRRETETLLRQTSENVLRLEDIQLVKKEGMAQLRRQAEVATRWEALDREKQREERIYHYVQWIEARRELSRRSARLRRTKEKIEAYKKELIDYAKARPVIRERAKRRQEAYQKIDHRLRRRERAIAVADGRREETLERKEKCRLRLEETITMLTQKEAQRRLVAREIERARHQAKVLARQSEEMHDRGGAQEELLVGARQALTKAKTDTEEIRQAKEKATQRLLAAKARTEATRDRLALCQKRMDRSNQREPIPTVDPREFALLEQEASIAQVRFDDAQADLVACEDAVESYTEERERLQKERQAALVAEKEWATRSRHLAQQRARMEKNEKYQEWLEEEGIAELPKWFRYCKIDPRWKKAVEYVLGAAAQAYLVRDLRVCARWESTRPSLSTVWWERAQKARPLDCTDYAFARPMVMALRQVDASIQRAVMNALCGVYMVENLESALAHRTEMSRGDIFVTPEADIVTATSVRIAGAGYRSQWSIIDEAEKADRLWQEKARSLDLVQEKVRDNAAKLARAQERLHVAQKLARRKDQAHRTLQMRVSRLREQMQAARRQQEDRKRGHRSLRQEARMLKEALDEWVEEVARLETVVEQVSEQYAIEAESLRRREEAFNFAQKEKMSSDYRQRLLTVEANERKKNVANLRIRAQGLVSDIAREKERKRALEKRLVAMRRFLRESVSPRMRTRLDQLRQSFEKAKESVAASKAFLARLDQKERRVQASLLPCTEQYGRRQSDYQAKEELYHGAQARWLAHNVDRFWMETQYQNDQRASKVIRLQIAKLRASMRALGDINHAALADLRLAQEEYQSLAVQLDDLKQGMQTLEGTIRTIDKESRDRMKKTFSAVQGHFQQMFQRLFGGGSATLTMVGDDVLESGIEVHAQPPGKKNASLRLLSGGRQALTATALVFAFFMMNPAPFCLLDEVDAPLDRANQMRLARLCHRLSHSTQFLLITHHRVTMEYMQALVGVTMKEPGVSRLVRVDVENAVQLSKRQAN